MQQPDEKLKRQREFRTVEFRTEAREAENGKKELVVRGYPILFNTPTKVTFGKSSPFATIWVPTIMSYSPAAKALSLRSCEKRVMVVSASIRRILAFLKISASSSSTFWVP